MVSPHFPALHTALLQAIHPKVAHLFAVSLSMLKREVEILYATRYGRYCWTFRPSNLGPDLAKVSFLGNSFTRGNISFFDGSLVDCRYGASACLDEFPIY